MGWYVGSAYWTSVSPYVGTEAAKCSLELKMMTFVLVFEHFIASVSNNPRLLVFAWGLLYIYFFSHLLYMYYMIRCLQPMKTLLSYILSNFLDKETYRSWLTMMILISLQTIWKPIAANGSLFQLILNNCLIYFSSRRISWWQKKL